jgi:GNAT superfamily N-acetyltransferase
LVLLAVGSSEGRRAADAIVVGGLRAPSRDEHYVRMLGVSRPSANARADLAKDVSLRYAWRLLKTLGLRAGVQSLARGLRFSRGKWIVVEGHLPGPPVRPGPDDGIVTREATEDDIGCLDSLRPHRDPELLRARVRHDGCLLYVARDRDQIAAFRLAGPRPPPYVQFLRLDRFFDLREGDLFVHETFAHPGYRKRGIAGRLLAVSNHALAARGYRRILSLVRTRNVPSLRLSLGKFTWPILYIEHVQFLFYRRSHACRQMPPKIAAALARRRTDSAGPPGT